MIAYGKIDSRRDLLGAVERQATDALGDLVDFRGLHVVRTCIVAHLEECENREATNFPKQK